LFYILCKSLSINNQTHLLFALSRVEGYFLIEGENLDKGVSEMETLVFEGREYRLTFEGEEVSWKRWASGYGDSQIDMYQWQGTGQVEESGKDGAIFFHFSTEPLSDHRVNWFHLHSFEHCIFFSERELRGNPYRANADDPNHVVYFELGLAVDRQAVVDYLGELIAGAIAETDDARVLSEIGIPSLDIDYLRNHGLVADSEGQIALAELAE